MPPNTTSLTLLYLINPAMEETHDGRLGGRARAGHGNTSDARLRIRIFDPLLVGFRVGLRIAWPSERAVKSIRITRKENIWKPWIAFPPQIPGYTFVQKLGSGSEANVYLYQQLSPSRQVAIKVSKGMLDPRAAARFRSEANFMGKISSHPYILSVYESGVTTTGNGYTVFEYAPGGNYKTFLESNRLNADQMLTVGINLASALSTAHREGIIHRDIKPSNILINTHGMPMLSDFGIARTIYGRPGIGYTIAWAPPEVLAKNGGGNESSDIYSLGATLFAMLTGQSPYEYGYSEALGATRGKERGTLLRNIILTNPLPKLNSPDVPPQVERILRKALNETPEDRYYSAYDFARDMQRVQQELYGHATPTTVEGEPPFPQNLYAQSQANIRVSPTAPKQRSIWAKPLTIVVSVVAAIAAVELVFAYVIMPNMDSVSDNSSVQIKNPETYGQENDSPDSAITTGSVPSVENLTGSYSADGGSVQFTWANPDPQNGDSYAWSMVGDAGVNPNTQGTTTDTHISIEPADGSQTCIQVSLIRADRQMSQNPAIACAAKP